MPQTANLDLKTENSAILGHKEAQLLENFYVDNFLCARSNGDLRGHVETTIFTIESSKDSSPEIE